MNRKGHMHGFYARVVPGEDGNVMEDTEAAGRQDFDRTGGQGYMLWGAVWHGGKSQLVFMEGTVDAARYVKECQPVLRSIVVANPHLKYVIEDGAPVHQGKAVDAGRKVMPGAYTRLTCPTMSANPDGTPFMRAGKKVLHDAWASNSPDLNQPIERVWGWMAQRMESGYPDLTSLKVHAQHLWDTLPQATVNEYIACMPRVLKSIIAKKGGMTKY